MCGHVTACVDNCIPRPRSKACEIRFAPSVNLRNLRRRIPWILPGVEKRNGVTPIAQLGNEMASEKLSSAQNEHFHAEGDSGGGPNILTAMSHPNELSPTTRFSARAGDYAKYRPTYPQAAIDWILEGIGAPTALRVADIGAGTGISSRLFADRGAQVVAVDPNPEMLAQAQRHTRIRFVVATAEETGLPTGSFNLVTCFQAFHWFKPVAAFAEFKRILKPRGRIAAGWNTRDRQDAFTAEYSTLIESFGEDAKTIERARGMGPVVESLSQAGLAHVDRAEFRHFHRMDEAGFVGYARSASYLPRDGAGYQRLRDGLYAIFERYADAEGFVVFPYLTKVFRGDRLGK